MSVVRIPIGSPEPLTAEEEVRFRALAEREPNFGPAAMSWIPGLLATIDDLRAALVRTPETLDVERVVIEMEHEGVVTWGDERHRDRFLAATPSPTPPEGPETPSERAWREALAQPSFRAALDEGLADIAAGRTERWATVRERLLAASPAPDPGAGPGVLALVAEERARQDAKWGEQNHGDLVWLAVLSEEVGEAGREILEVRARTGYVDPLPTGQADHLAAEVVQVAAVAVAWVEAIFRRVAPSAEPPETET